MKFEEKDDCIVTVYKNQEIGMIYFLIKENEVVYVGQSRKSSGRPFDHGRDKDFDTIKILFCGLSNLDYIEDYYIYKYKPMYNVKNKAENPYTMLLIKKRLDVIFDNVPEILELKEIISDANLTMLYKYIPVSSWNKNSNIVQEYLNFIDYMKLVKYIVENPRYGIMLKDTKGFYIWDA